MTQKQISQWRTVGLVALFGALLFVAFIVLILRQSPPGEGAVKLFDLLSTGLFLLVATAAGKSATEHLANGRGTGGMWKVLTTDAKPGDPSAPAPPPGSAP
jgi:hypothetical protein